MKYRNLLYRNCLANSRAQARWFYSTLSVSSGPCGVDGRLPSARKHSIESNSEDTAIAITDPFILYQNYVAQGILQKDEFQLRAMKEFQKLYHRVLEYTPPEELSIKISLLLRKLEVKQAEARRTPLSAISSLFKKDPEKEKKQIVRFITDEDELYNFASPQGLIINGEVGCGKSMLMDIFAASLPHKSKMRWHYNNFILWVFAEMHQIQKERFLTSTLKNGEKIQLKYTMENEFVLFEIAQKMIQKNTILMLDEFMLPDIAAANIIKILFTYYFKLGGVLVATSNKLPEELYSNEFHKKKFHSFVSILNARCMSVDMRSTTDYRLSFAAQASSDPYLIVKSDVADHDIKWLRLLKTKAIGISEDSPELSDDIPLESLGEPSSLTVYNRTTYIPLTFNNDTVCYLDYSYICKGLYSSSDYITLASRYKTVILDNVPIMTTKMKNEARRFITFLDAIYEAKCQFFMRSEVEVDYLFFPDASDNLKPEIREKLENIIDSIDSNRLEVQEEEMFAKTAIAASSPYRPNVASYDQESMENFNEFAKNLKNAIVGDNSKKNEEDVDFKNLRAFTGDDEKFAFKRAVSRITEMVGSEVWRTANRWVPVDSSMRPWEPSEKRSQLAYISNKPSVQDVIDDANAKVDALISENKNIREMARRYLKDALPKNVSAAHEIPFHQFNSRIAPTFNIEHFWGMSPWTTQQGKKLKDVISRAWIRTGSRTTEQ
ncbi:ATPase family protein [Scheffersomyces stipitis CBS 6054]|uniref:ATPase family protein n=1 Tax=Scheffersomyces stipitis (strain ATCC 58785 / CBS 6054 / NBRC 10063 / NRRL Y-11545) TaxID=322104 RepID=A3LPR2_PICST|nr:ATPase family protein [Scheffersomyces stipitis CBS 6054]ABN65085.2 ATPase family protein [Scheffersomyces stipitis CBS 6054]KAG2735920.1 hypothetical protein G9P44_000010 [Scheffersomyces stipitis]